MRGRVIRFSCLLFLLQSCATRKGVEFDAFIRSDGMVLRSPSSGKVYLVSNGQRHYVPGPGVMEALGIVCLPRDVDDSLMDSVPLGADMPMLTTKVVQNPQTKEVFLLECGKRRYVPDPQTISALNLESAVRPLQPDQINLIPVGPPLPHAGGVKP